MKHCVKAVLILAGGVTLLGSLASAAPVFVNGSFEADATTGFQSVDPTGWVTHRTGAPPYLINNSTYGNTPFGNQFLAIGGSEDGAASWIEQTLSGFTIGNTYRSRGPSRQSMCPQISSGSASLQDRPPHHRCSPLPRTREAPNSGSAGRMSRCHSLQMPRP
jgi:hypothetical protein